MERYPLGFGLRTFRVHFRHSRYQCRRKYSVAVCRVVDYYAGFQHGSRAPSDPLHSVLARQAELLDTVGVAVTILVLTWGFFDRFWRLSAIQRQRNPANGDDVELQILGGRDDAPQPHHEHIELRVRDEEGLFAGEMDIEAGGELRNVDGVDDFVVNMPGAFPA